MKDATTDATTIELTLEEFAAILRANAADADKALPLSECLLKFRAAPEPFRRLWTDTARRYWHEKKD